MSKFEDRATWRQRMIDSEREQREALAELVDEVYLAFRQSGGTAEEYIQTQFFQNLLFQSVNQTTVGTKEREGALKLTLIFMRRLKQHYVDMAKDPDWLKAHEIR